MTLKVQKVTILDNYDSYAKAYGHMEHQGVKHLGWINNGINIPKHLKFEKVYSSWSGVSCLYVDPVHRVSYSVDMGD